MVIIEFLITYCLSSLKHNSHHWRLQICTLNTQYLASEYKRVLVRACSFTGRIPTTVHKDCLLSWRWLSWTKQAYYLWGTSCSISPAQECWLGLGFNTLLSDSGIGGYQTAVLFGFDTMWSWHHLGIRVTSQMSHHHTHKHSQLSHSTRYRRLLWDCESWLSLTHSWDRQNKDYCSKLSQNISRIVILWPQPIMMTPVSDSFIFYTLSTHQYQPDIQIFINITGDKVHHIPLLVSGPQRSVSFLPWM